MIADRDDRTELTRVRRVADMLCTGHAALAERYAGRAFAMDMAVLALSAWVVALAFVDPQISPKLTPPGLTPTIWIGLMGLGAFVLTLLQMRLDLRGRADAHRRAFDAYAEVKREAGRLLSEDEALDVGGSARLFSRYDFASSLGIGMPEGEFLRQKRRHLIKVQISRHLDSHPSACIACMRVRWWWQENFGRAGRRDSQDPLALKNQVLPHPPIASDDGSVPNA